MDFPAKNNQKKGITLVYRLADAARLVSCAALHSVEPHSSPVWPHQPAYIQSPVQSPVFSASTMHFKGHKHDVDNIFRNRLQYRFTAFSNDIPAPA